MKAKEIQKDLEAKKRGLSLYHSDSAFCRSCNITEKLEDAKARARVKAQIEADRRERAEKAAREKALREGKPVPGSSAAPTATPAAASSAPKAAGKDYPETRLQIRLASGGQPYTTTLPSDSSTFLPLPHLRSQCAPGGVRG